METVENNLVIGKRAKYSNEYGGPYTGIIVDKVKVGLASGTNEYSVVDKYMIKRDDGTLDDVYPYFVDSIK